MIAFLIGVIIVVLIIGVHALIKIEEAIVELGEKV